MTGAWRALPRLWRTLRPLRAEQFPWLAFHSLRRRAPQRWQRAAAQSLTRDVTGSPRWESLHQLRQHMGRYAWPDALAEARRFVDERVDLVGFSVEHDGIEAFRWDRSPHGRLWHYELHYLDALLPLAASGTAEDHQRLVRLLDAYLRANAAGSDPGWEPYPASLRAMNFLRAAAWLAPASRPVAARMVLEARRICAWLPWLWEAHLQANHLMANCMAMAMCALCTRRLGPAEPHAIRRLDVELARQFLEDGGHIERSPLYHEQLTCWLSELAALAPPSIRDRWRDLHGRAERFAEHLRHPDGSRPLFNDSTRWGGPASCWPADRARSPLEPAYVAKQTGYAALRMDPWVLIADFGPPGPDWQLGHAHCDQLSFELSAHGQRLLVNRGLSGYADDPHRSYCRSVEAHTTVQVDGAEPLELWGSFRVGRRSTPALESAPRADSAERYALAAHMRWQTLAHRPVHRRQWSVDAAGSVGRVRVQDGLEGARRGGVARYHVAPGVRVRVRDDRRAELTLAGGGATVQMEATEPIAWTSTRHFDQFGMPEIAATAVIRFHRELRVQYLADRASPR